MTKIKTYESDGVITDKDKVIGSDGDNALITRNYTFKEIRDFVKQGLSPEVGGTLKLTELTYNGGLYSTPQEFVNSLDPIVTVLKYELVIVSVNGNKWLFRKYDTTIGLAQTPTTIADYVSISSSSQDLQSVLDNGNTTNKDFYHLENYGVSVIKTGIIESAQPLPFKLNGVEVNTDGVVNKLGFSIGEGGFISSYISGSQSSDHYLGFIFPNNKPNPSFPSIDAYTLATLDDIPSVDGSETKIQAGTNVTVSGNGTTATPYVVNSSGGSVNQDNFVKTITINYTDLPNGYSEQDICDYILALPSNQRTILETDSKWNVVIVENVS